MAVVRLEVKTRQPLAGGQEFGDVSRYAQLDGTAHFAVDPAHPLNEGITDIGLAARDRDGLVHFTADFQILTPEDARRGNRRLLFDVPNRCNRLALAAFNRVPRPINPSAATDPGDQPEADALVEHHQCRPGQPARGQTRQPTGVLHPRTAQQVVRVSTDE